MIEWHVLDAWSVRDGRGGPIWIVIQTVGGFAAPLFLFLAGVAIPFAIGSRVRRGDDLQSGAWSVQQRGWEVFGIAHLFRFQSFLLNPTATWSSIFRPDILNILGLGLAGTSVLCGRAMRSRRVLWLIVPAVAIFALTPWSRLWSWPSQLPGRLEAYIRPGNGLGVFQIFPWAGYVPFGALLGLLLGDVKDEAAERRLLGRFAIGGLAAALGGAGGYFIDARTPAAFWLEAWSSLAMRCGLMTLALAASKWVVQPQPQITLSPILLFGRTSLFVYIVHVELAYGVWSYPLHDALPLTWSWVGLAAMYVLMYYAAGWWERRPQRPWIPIDLKAGV